VAYHETFWVVAGAAAPVIALAAVIQLREISGAVEDVKDRLTAYRAAQGITYAERMQGTPRERRRRAKNRGDLQPGFLPFLMLLAYFNLVVQADVLVGSLDSLRQHTDLPVYRFVVSIMQFSLYDLAFISFGVVFVRGRWMRKLDRAASEMPDTTDRNDSGEPSSPLGDTSPMAD
jgi:hypothetical protein